MPAVNGLVLIVMVISLCIVRFWLDGETGVLVESPSITEPIVKLENGSFSINNDAEDTVPMEIGLLPPPFVKVVKTKAAPIYAIAFNGKNAPVIIIPVAPPSISKSYVNEAIRGYEVAIAILYQLSIRKQMLPRRNYSLCASIYIKIIFK